MKRRLLFLLLPVILLAACQPSRTKSAEAIKKLENELFSPSANSFEKAKADSLITLYEDFIRRFPEDTLSAAYTFKAANIAMNMSEGPEAITLFDQYLINYPDKPKAEMCLFFKAYIYENVMRNLDKAKEIYLLFIEKYPKSQFADDARLALQNLGKSPEEMIREFEMKQKADSARRADSVAALTLKKHKKK